MKLPLPKTDNKKDYFIQRTFEIFPGLISWITLFLMVLLSFIKPVWVALFIIVFDVYWILKAVYLIILIYSGYRKMRINIAVDWLDRCKGISGNIGKHYLDIKENLDYLQNCLEKNKSNPELCKINNYNIMRLKENLSLKTQIKIFKDYLYEIGKIKNNPTWQKEILSWKEVEHVVIIPTFKESVDILEGNVEGILKSNYPNEKLHVFVGFEETAKKAGDNVQKKREILEKKYKGKFGTFQTTLHPIRKNEKAGSGSNETYIAKVAKKYCDKKGFNLAKTTLTSFDAEAYCHKEYFASLTYHFIVNRNRTHRAYQPLPFYSNTIWYAPGYSRTIAMGATFWHMFVSIRDERLVTFSNHTHSFKAVHEAGYWPVNYIVNDDSAIFWRCYFKYDGEYKTIPLYIPVSQDAVYVKGNIWATFKASYKQIRRWAYGIEHLSTIIRAFLSDKNKKISFFDKFRHIFILIEGAHSWATNALMVAFLGWLPLLFGGVEFRQMVISKNLPDITRYLMTFSMMLLAFSIYYGFILVPKKPKNFPFWKNISLIFMWLWSIFMATVLGSFPALEAQTKLMLGKYMGYDVTPKARGKKN